MAKKSKPGETPTAAPAALKHNPFAALAGVPAAPAPAQPASEQKPPPPSSPGTPAVPSAPKSGKSLGRLVLRRETKHRGGKAVIIVTGFGALASFDEAATRALAQQLKQQLGCGGTVEQGASGREIVLQGDRAAKVAEILRARGFRVDGVTS